ncbi:MULTISPECIES: S24 family peptidase [Kutzneria]|uniref:S24 family peptidase n=1 Tax=Kutzneria TaxID=43356 RepID=UPI0004BA372A
MRVRGPSMAPALRDGDVLLVRLRAKPVPGAVVLVSWPSRPGQLSVKRAVREEPGGWVVHGDNPLATTDSRQLGPARVHGVFGWRLWPRPGRLSA